jgi:hypothetical protein
VELVVAFGLATAAGVLIATTTQVGPVLLSLTDSHGIHLGDVLAFAVFYAAALGAALLVRRPGMLTGYALATLVALALAGATRIGPDLVRVAAGFTIQLGDVFAFPTCCAAVALAGWLRRRGPRHS